MTKKDGKKLEIHNQAEAQQVTEDLKKAHYQVTDCSVRDRLRKPAPPFTTSSLQQEANKRLNFSTKKVMMLAQQLYEGVTLGRKGSIGLITYMRTDSVNLSSLCINASTAVIKELMGRTLRQEPSNSITKTKGAQEAHEAIRPTYMDQTEIEGTPQERRLYDLIWKRTIASQMADAELEKTTVTISISSSSEVFTAIGEVIKFDGFLRVYRESYDDENEQEDESNLLPPLKKGQKLEHGSYRCNRTFLPNAHRAIPKQVLYVNWRSWESVAHLRMRLPFPRFRIANMWKKAIKTEKNGCSMC
mgnify:CR=1 FL=1